MTKEEAIRLLRTEQLGDSERMEVAKQMGAKALERSELHLVAPVCERCGRAILNVEIGVEIGSGPGYFDMVLMRYIDPACCPNCGTVFIRADINYEEQTCILRGTEKEANE